MFLIMGLTGAQVVNFSLPSSQKVNIEHLDVLFISFAFGFSLIVNAWIFFRVSGSLFNPAVAISLAVSRVISPLRAILLVISQLLGSITAAGLVQIITPGPLLVANNLGPGVSVVQGHSNFIHANGRSFHGDYPHYATRTHRVYGGCRKT